MNHNAVKDVYIFNSKSKIIDHKSSNKQNAEIISKSVGRVFIKCIEKWFCTTGFCLADDIVVSWFSKKSISQLNSENQQINNKIEKIFIYFGNNATINYNIEFDLQTLEINSDIFELEILNNQQEDSSINQLNNESGFEWCGSDLTFLTFKDRRPKLECYVFPSYQLVENKCPNYYIIGYSNHTEYTTMKKENTELSQSDYNQLCMQNHNFQHKALYICKDVNRSGHLISFKASTIRGTAGGITTTFEDTNKILGIHIGGSLTTKYSLSVTHPIFYNAYKRYINQEFINKHLTILRPYFDYCDSYGD